MSDLIKHECGIALVRLRKPLSYYIEKYGTPLYAVNKLYLLMQKQHNRGQDGAGIANIKIDLDPGYKYLSRLRSNTQQPISDIFDKISKKIARAEAEGEQKFYDQNWLKQNYDFTGEVWLGHLRYGTYGKNNIESCHPILRQNNWKSRNLVVAGNFNVTNLDELFEKLIDLGQSPRAKIDTVIIMEKIGHFLDEENQRIFDKYKGKYSNREITSIIESDLDLRRVLARACKDLDGGFAMAGLVGHGASFIIRDAAGIRPAYYYVDDEVVVSASEKPAIKTAFNVDYGEIKELQPAHALIVDKKGDWKEAPYTEPLEKKACSFERIYFSRGSDPDIYNERKQLGHLLVPQVLKAIDYDLANTVFSYIPNTAETAFIGMMAGIDDYLVDNRKDVILDGTPDDNTLEELLSFKPRVEKLVIKDAKLRTFITDDAHRDDLVSHVYDTTYEVIRKGIDQVVVIDDSIVRGTTLQKSILRMLDRIGPRKIIIVSSAPQIRFPDCYGIDMSRMREFIAFRAAIALIKERGMENLLDEIYDKCVASERDSEPQNFVKEVYGDFSEEEMSKKIGEIVTPNDMHANVTVVYQYVANLHKACPNHTGDWYFTGNYPTSGGNKVVNKSFTNYMEGKTIRAY